MEHNVVDFITLCESPYVSGKQNLQNKSPKTGFYNFFYAQIFRILMP